MNKESCDGKGWDNAVLDVGGKSGRGKSVGRVIKGCGLRARRTFGTGEERKAQ